MRKKNIYIYSEQEKRVTMSGWFEVVDLWEKNVFSWMILCNLKTSTLYCIQPYS